MGIFVGAARRENSWKIYLASYHVIVYNHRVRKSYRGGSTMNLKTLQRTAREMLKSYGLNEWWFSFDRSVRRFGCCHYKDRNITMSRAMSKLNDDARCLNTLLHEIAHALVGHGHGHNQVWRAKAISIGCDGKRLYSSATTATVGWKYSGICSDCGKVIGQYHRRRKLYHRLCRNVNAPNRGRMDYKIN